MLQFEQENRMQDYGMMPILCGVLLLFVCLSAGKDPIERSEEIENEKQIISEILKSYDPEERPPPYKEKSYSAVTILVNMVVLRARWDKDIADMELILRQEWSDSRLTYLEHVAYVTIPPSKSIWLPDTFFATAEETEKWDDKRFVRVDHEGWVTYSQRYTLKAQCKPSDSAYPMVYQKVCSLKLGSYAFTMHDLMYIWRGGSSAITFNAEPGTFQEYSLSDFEPFECNANVTTGKYSCIQVNLYFQGPIHEPIIYFYLPSLLLLFCSWLHFWIHGSWTVPRSLSAFLPFFLFMLALLFLPHPQVEEITAYEVWLVFCAILSFLSFLQYILCIYVGVRRPYTLSDAEKPLLSENKEDEKGTEPARTATTPPVMKLDCVCRIIFPIVFIIFVALYIILFMVI